jgi:hypothetical protein
MPSVSVSDSKVDAAGYTYVAGSISSTREFDPSVVRPDWK